MEEQLRHIEGFKEHLSDFDSVADWVVWRFGEKDGMLFRVNFEIFEDIAPYCFHLIPILDDSVFDWIVQLY